MGKGSATPVGVDVLRARRFTRGNFLRMGGALAAGSAAAPMPSACGGSGSAAGKGLAGTTLTTATVSDSQMEDIQSLFGHFTEKTGIKVR